GSERGVWRGERHRWGAFLLGARTPSRNGTRGAKCPRKTRTGPPKNQPGSSQGNIENEAFGYGPVETVDQTNFDRVFADAENDRDRCGGSFGRQASCLS